METSVKEQARFDARLPKSQKQFFEKAAMLGGFRNLTEFVFATVEQKAKEIISEKELIIASERDGQIFFGAITNAKKPSKNLTDALKDYNGFMANSND